MVNKQYFEVIALVLLW